MGIETVKNYLRVDYDDDDELILLMLDAVLDEMSELIKDFNRDAPTNRQKLLILAYVKELYDSRGKITTSNVAASNGQERMRYVVQSLMMKELLRGE